ncbi:MAG: undecaprenyl-diphosphate phosphatase [Deltaproteobacteria bacterium]|nr:undecaprenyl-diphosphate phosphatase [Deltaproteobacteria bacterium]
MEKQKKFIRCLFSILLEIVVVISMMGVPSVVFCGDNKEVHGAPAAEMSVRPLSLWDAAILGVVEGVTEYLPVSSTGHLLLTEHILGLANDPANKRVANAYAIVIQAGAILAVLGLYRNRIRQMLLGLIGKDASGQSLFWNLVIAFLPAVVVGLLLEDVIKGRLFGIWPVTAAWFGGGIFILFLDKKRPHELSGLSIESFGWRQGLGIGLMQCAALWPGVSRSLATIAGGLLMGAELTAAVEFSFLLGLMTLGAATMYEAYKNGHMIVASFGLAGPLLGFFCAFVSAWISIKWMVSFLQRRGLALFGWYRIILALVVAAVLLSGVGLQS